MAESLRNNALKTFNQENRVPEGWFWALPSAHLKKKKAACVTVAGKDLVIFRGENGQAIALDAYCPHRGSHLGLGTVEGNAIRCGYHRWKYDATGRCVDIPCRSKIPGKIGVNQWHTKERYSMVWVWTGAGEPHPIFEIPELEGCETDSAIANDYVQNCHPNVVMSDAIDVEHFRSVHRIPGEILNLEIQEVNPHTMHFHNTARAPQTHWFGRLLRLFYKGPITYDLTYWYGSTGCITVGPDFLHFHVIFANRLGTQGKSEGQVILVTKKRSGVLGRLGNSLFLYASKLVSGYFGRGDTPQFNRIKFDFKNPIKEDRTIISFIKHVEALPIAQWGFSRQEEASPVMVQTLSQEEEPKLHQIENSRSAVA